MNTNYRPDIDGLRALAVLAVICFHAQLKCPGGFVGVDIFFVISGFLITSHILKEMRHDSFSLVAFWERRIRRILPVVVFVVFATFVVAWFLFLPEDLKNFGKSVMAQATLISNIYFYTQTGYFSASYDTQPILHTWSLAVEEQFYIVFPVMLLFLARHTRFCINRFILAIWVVSFILSIAGSYLIPDATFYFLPTRAWELLTGSFLVVLPGKRPHNPWLGEAIALAGLGMILFSIFFYTSETRFPGLAAIPPCFGAALIIFSGSFSQTCVRRLLVFRPVVFVGLISYSLYLWHWPLLVFARYRSMDLLGWKQRVGLLAGSGALAVVSWKWIEMPFRKRFFCATRQQIFLFASCSILGLLITGEVCLIPKQLPAMATKFLNCRNDFAFRNEISPEQAAIGQFAELGTQNLHQHIDVLIWGDSHAMALAPILDEFCRRFSLRGVEATHSATAPILGYTSARNSAAFSRSVIKFIADKHVTTVILAASWANYRSFDLVDKGLTATVQAIMGSGAKVYVVKDVPVPGFNLPRQAALTVIRHGDLARLEGSPEKYETRNQNYDLVFSKLSKAGATILDPSKYFLNTNGLYDVIRNGKLLYFDSDHLTTEGSKLLYPMFLPLFCAKDVPAAHAHLPK